MANPSEASSIFVGIRVRPFVPRETKKNEKRCVDMANGEVNLRHPQSGSVTGFRMDELMDSSVEPNHPYYFDQPKVYEKLGKRILDTCLQGYTTSLFAYGQTGAGKTTSVMGDLAPAEKQGILPRLLNDLFEGVAKDQQQGWSVQIRCRMMEIYNERLNDLLRPATREPIKLEVRSHPEFGQYVPNLTATLVESVHDCMGLLEYGHTMQTVASTQMNAKSSRAHTLFVMKFEKEMPMGNTTKTESYELYMVDLAGRENEKTTLATGERLVELSFINKSLFHLANCIAALGKDESNKKNAKGDAAGANYPKIKIARDIGKANFRNSKLTLLLQVALSGNSKTFMIGAISPAESAYDENFVTLRFAAQAKNITLTSRKNTAGKEDQTKSLQDEIMALKAQLAEKMEGDLTGESVSLREQLDAAQTAVMELTETVDHLKHEAHQQKANRALTMMQLGVMKTKYGMDVKGGGANMVGGGLFAPLPYISNECADPYMSGRLVYCLAEGGSSYFGCDEETLKRFAESENNYVEYDHPHNAANLGYHNNCNQLRGLGISPKLCKVTAVKEEGGDDGSTYKMSITRLSKDGIVHVNGQSVKNGDTVALSHGDKIMLGRAFIFRVHMDSSEPWAHDELTLTPRAQRNRYDTAENIKIAIKRLLPPTELNDVNKVYLAKTYISHLSNISVEQEEKVFRFLYEAVKTQHLVEEANEITGALRPQDNLRFELNTMQPVLYMGYPDSYVPQMLIRVVRTYAPHQKRWRNIRNVMHATKGHLSENYLAAMDEDHHHPEHVEDGVEVLFTWTLVKFMGRLDMMREIYHSWIQGISFTVDLKEDPWVEVGPVEMDFWMQSREASTQKQMDALEAEKAAKDEEIAQLKSKCNAQQDESQDLLNKVKVLKSQQEELEKLHRAEKASTRESNQNEMALKQEIAKLRVDLDSAKQEKEKAAAQFATQRAELQREMNDQVMKNDAINKKALIEERMRQTDEKDRMSARFIQEREALQQEMAELKAAHERTLLTNDDHQAIAFEKERADLLLQFEKEKTELRSNFKSDLESIRAMEREEAGIRDKQHEQQLNLLNDLLDEAKAEIKHLKAQQYVSNTDLQNAITLIEPGMTENSEACNQLKRCMELSLANQKLLDQLFEARKERVSASYMGSQMSQGEAGTPHSGLAQ